MDRRSFIAASVGGLAAAGVTNPAEGRIYSIENGDRGRCFVDGHEVRAVECRTGADGFAIVIRPDAWRPGMRSCPRVRIDGNVRFEPFGDAA